MTKASFTQFGPTFQEKIVQALLVDKTWAQQVSEIIDTDYFDLEYLKYLSTQYFSYFLKYKNFPTFQLLITIVRDDFKNNKSDDTALRDQVIDYLHRMKNNPEAQDLKFVKEKTFDFCRRQAFKIALEEAVELVLFDKYDDVVSRMKKAISAGIPLSIGHELLEDHEQRWAITNRSPIPTGIKELDQKEVLNGGLGKGELGVVVAPTGIGKSHWLVMLGCNALKRGLNVVHYTFELSEGITGIRYDSNICDTSSTDIPLKQKENLKVYKDLKGSMGRLFIKEYPANFPTINTLRAHLEKLQLAKNFKPDVILIDYADIMRSTHRYDSLRHELKLVYEELRGWASEMEAPIWTASQTNRDGSDHEIVELKNISEAYGKAMVADVVLSISRKLSDKANNMGRLHVAKNRAGRDGLVYNVEIDTSKSNFKVVSEYSTAEDAKNEQGDELKSAMKQKWKELNTDPVVSLKSVINS